MARPKKIELETAIARGAGGTDEPLTLTYHASVRNPTTIQKAARSTVDLARVARTNTMTSIGQWLRTAAQISAAPRRSRRSAKCAAANSVASSTSIARLWL